MLRRVMRSLVLAAFMCCILPQYSVAQIIDLCVDPGHGGTESGTPTHYSNWHEDDINLMVANALLDTLTWYGHFFNIKYTRTTDSTVDLEDRPDLANQWDAQAFISIHHNGSADTLTKQGTETWYCNNTEIPGGESRNPTDTLAMKIYMRQRDGFGYGRRGVREGNKYVLAYSKMPSTLTEASFVSTPLFDDEATKFHDSVDFHHRVEAGAIYRGWHSTTTGQGFGVVEYDYVGKSGSDQPDVEIGVGFGNPSWLYNVPYEGNWGWNEFIYLNAIDFTNSDTDQYNFHHWEERDFTADTLVYCYNDYQNPIDFNVWWADDGMHWYVAFFTGGPFDIFLHYPDSQTTEIIVNDTVTILWDVAMGVRQSCSLYIDLSINDGSSWTPIAGPLPYNHSPGSRNTGTFDWIVPDVSSDYCRLRLIAFDMVDNHDTLISHRFAIQCYEPTAKFSASVYSGEYPLPVQFFDYSTYDPFAWS